MTTNTRASVKKTLQNVRISIEEQKFEDALSMCNDLLEHGGPLSPWAPSTDQFPKDKEWLPLAFSALLFKGLALFSMIKTRNRPQGQGNHSIASRLKIVDETCRRAAKLQPNLLAPWRAQMELIQAILYFNFSGYKNWRSFSEYSSPSLGYVTSIESRAHWKSRIRHKLHVQWSCRLAQVYMDLIRNVIENQKTDKTEDQYKEKIISLKLKVASSLEEATCFTSAAYYLNDIKKDSSVPSEQVSKAVSRLCVVTEKGISRHYKQGKEELKFLMVRENQTTENEIHFPDLTDNTFTVEKEDQYTIEECLDTLDENAQIASELTELPPSIRAYHSHQRLHVYLLKLSNEREPWFSNYVVKEIVAKCLNVVEGPPNTKEEPNLTHMNERVYESPSSLAWEEILRWLVRGKLPNSPLSSQIEPNAFKSESERIEYGNGTHLYRNLHIFLKADQHFQIRSSYIKRFPTRKFARLLLYEITCNNWLKCAEQRDYVSLFLTKLISKKLGQWQSGPTFNLPKTSPDFYYPRTDSPLSYTRFKIGYHAYFSSLDMLVISHLLLASLYRYTNVYHLSIHHCKSGLELIKVVENQWYFWYWQRFHILLAQCFKLGKSHESAISTLKNLLQTCPEHYEARVALAEIYYEHKDFIQALSEFQRIRQDYPDQSWPMARIAWIQVLPYEYKVFFLEKRMEKYADQHKTSSEKSESMLPKSYATQPDLESGPSRSCTQQNQANVLKKNDKNSSALSPVLSFERYASFLTPWLPPECIASISSLTKKIPDPLSSAINSRDLFISLAEKHSEQPWYHYWLGCCYWIFEKYALARESWLTACKLHLPIATFRLGDSYLLAYATHGLDKDLVKAKNCYSMALKQYQAFRTHDLFLLEGQGNGALLVEAAFRLLEVSNVEFESAQHICQDPGISSDSSELKSSILNLLNSLSRAGIHMALFRLALFHIRNHEIRVAILHLQAYLRRVPNDTKAWFCLVNCYTRTKQYLSAFKVLARLLTIDADSIYYWYLSARLKRLMGDLDGAEKDATRTFFWGSKEERVTRAQAIRDIEEQVNIFTYRLNSSKQVEKQGEDESVHNNSGYLEPMTNQHFKTVCLSNSYSKAYDQADFFFLSSGAFSLNSIPLLSDKVHDYPPKLVCSVVCAYCRILLEQHNRSLHLLKQEVVCHHLSYASYIADLYLKTIGKKVFENLDDFSKKQWWKLIGDLSMGYFFVRQFCMLDGQKKMAPRSIIDKSFINKKLVPRYEAVYQKLEEGVRAYSRVIQLDPESIIARIDLAAAYQSLARLWVEGYYILGGQPGKNQMSEKMWDEHEGLSEIKSESKEEKKEIRFEHKKFSCVLESLDECVTSLRYALFLSKSSNTLPRKRKLFAQIRLWRLLGEVQYEYLHYLNMAKNMQVAAPFQLKHVPTYQTINRYFIKAIQLGSKQTYTNESQKNQLERKMLNDESAPNKSQNTDGGTQGTLLGMSYWLIRETSMAWAHASLFWLLNNVPHSIVMRTVSESYAIDSQVNLTWALMAYLMEQASRNQLSHKRTQILSEKTDELDLKMTDELNTEVLPSRRMNETRFLRCVNGLIQSLETTFATQMTNYLFEGIEGLIMIAAVYALLALKYMIIYPNSCSMQIAEEGKYSVLMKVVPWIETLTDFHPWNALAHHLLYLIQTTLSWTVSANKSRTASGMHSSPLWFIHEEWANTLVSYHRRVQGINEMMLLGQSESKEKQLDIEQATWLNLAVRYWKTGQISKLKHILKYRLLEDVSKKIEGIPIVTVMCMSLEQLEEREERKEISDWTKKFYNLSSSNTLHSSYAHEALISRYVGCYEMGCDDPEGKQIIDQDSSTSLKTYLEDPMEKESIWKLFLHTWMLKWLVLNFENKNVILINAIQWQEYWIEQASRQGWYNKNTHTHNVYDLSEISGLQWFWLQVLISTALPGMAASMYAGIRCKSVLDVLSKVCQTVVISNKLLKRTDFFWMPYEGLIVTYTLLDMWMWLKERRCGEMNWVITDKEQKGKEHQIEWTIIEAKLKDLTKKMKEIGKSLDESNWNEGLNDYGFRETDDLLKKRTLWNYLVFERHNDWKKRVSWKRNWIKLNSFRCALLSELSIELEKGEMMEDEQDCIKKIQWEESEWNTWLKLEWSQWMLEGEERQKQWREWYWKSMCKNHHQLLEEVCIIDKKDQGKDDESELGNEDKKITLDVYAKRCDTMNWIYDENYGDVSLLPMKKNDVSSQLEIFDYSNIESGLNVSRLKFSGFLAYFPWYLEKAFAVAQTRVIITPCDPELWIDLIFTLCSMIHATCTLDMKLDEAWRAAQSSNSPDSPRNQNSSQSRDLLIKARMEMIGKLEPRVKWIVKLLKTIWMDNHTDRIEKSEGKGNHDENKTDVNSEIKITNVNENANIGIKDSSYINIKETSTKKKLYMLIDDTKKLSFRYSIHALITISEYYLLNTLLNKKESKLKDANSILVMGFEILIAHSRPNSFTLSTGDLIQTFFQLTFQALRLYYVQSRSRFTSNEFTSQLLSQLKDIYAIYHHILTSTNSSVVMPYLFTLQPIPASWPILRLSADSSVLAHLYPWLLHHYLTFQTFTFHVFCTVSTSFSIPVSILEYSLGPDFQALVKRHSASWTVHMTHSFSKRLWDFILLASHYSIEKCKHALAYSWISRMENLESGWSISPSSALAKQLVASKIDKKKK